MSIIKKKEIISIFDKKPTLILDPDKKIMWTKNISRTAEQPLKIG